MLMEPPDFPAMSVGNHGASGAVPSGSLALWQNVHQVELTFRDGDAGQECL